MPKFYGRGLQFKPPLTSTSLFGLGDDTSTFPDDLPDPTAGDTSGTLDSGTDGILIDSPTGALDPNDLGPDATSDWTNVFTQMRSTAPGLTAALQGMQTASANLSTPALQSEWTSANDQLVSAVAQFNILADAVNSVSDLIPGGMIPNAGVSGLAFIPAALAGISVGGALVIIAACIAAIAAVNALLKKIFGKNNAVSAILDSTVAAVNVGVTKPVLYALLAVGLFMILGAEKR